MMPAVRDDRLRVLQAYEPPQGGVAEYVLHATRGLVARGHEVVVTGPADGRARRGVERCGARYVPLPWVGAVPAPAADRAVLGGLGDLLAEWRPDLLHAHAQKAGILGRIAASRAGVAAAYTPHSFVYRTQMLRPRRAAFARLVATRAVERRLGASTRMLIGCSYDEAAAAVRDGIVPLERSTQVAFGLERDVTVAPAPALTGLPGEGPLLGIVATLRDQKGLPDLLEALELLARQGRAVRFVVVGAGPMRDEVARRIDDPVLRETTWLVDFEGAVEPYLAALDAFVLPSLWEGLPIAVLEAMAFGLPVVATAVNGTPEVVSDGLTGILVPPGDPARLAEALATVAGDAELRERWGAAGREVVGRRFGVQRMVDELEQAYRRALALA